jgi:N-acetylglucosamine-6-phosphate deacetylase
MITMATNSMENFYKGIDAAGAYMRSGMKGLLGLHLEGPWISPAKSSHIESFISKPSRRDAELLIEKEMGLSK